MEHRTYCLQWRFLNSALVGLAHLSITLALLSATVLCRAQGIITTVAGNGTAGFSGDGGPATSAALNFIGEAVDGAGNLYIADTYNNRVRKVATSTGIISTVAGNGTAGFSGDAAAATSAALNGPVDVAVDASGNLYIAEVSTTWLIDYTNWLTVSSTNSASATSARISSRKTEGAALLFLALLKTTGTT